jgi:hypothetical protein
MIGKIKALGLAFVAVTAMTAVAASAAQASSLDLGSTPAVLTGHSDPAAQGFQQHILQIPGKEGSAPFNSICDTASLEGSVAGPSPVTEGTVTATYSACKLAGTAATVQMNGCKYTLTGAAQPATTFLVDVVGCTTGKQIQIKTALCTVDIPVQNGLSHLVATNNQTNKHITAAATVTGITAVQTGAACPGGNGFHTNAASFTGNTTVTGFVDKGTEQVTEHGHQFAKVKHLSEEVTLVAT